MTRIYRVAGSAYTYTRRSIGSHLGFLVGWATLLDYFFIPMVIWLIGAAFFSSAFPAVPIWLWTTGFILITSTLNIIGIKIAASVNSALMDFQLLVLAIFVILSLCYVWSGGAPLLSSAPWFNSATTFSGVVAGAALAAYAFLGFDAVTTLTEETIAPTKTMPRAIMFIVLVGGGLFILTAYTTQLVHRGFVFRDVDSAALDIAKTIGQQLFASIFLAGMIVAQFTSASLLKPPLRGYSSQWAATAFFPSVSSVISILAYRRRFSTSSFRVPSDSSRSCLQCPPLPHS